MSDQLLSPTSSQASIDAYLLNWPSLTRDERQVVIERTLNYFQPNDVDGLIGLLRAPRGFGIYASTGPNYHYAVFGRDSIEFAEDILSFRPQLCREIICLLARLQGRIEHNETEEEPGKIHHEFRARRFGLSDVSHAASIVFDELSAKWGGEDGELCYYGTVDATPLFIRLVDRYVTLYGDSLLGELITDRHGHQLSLQAHVRMASEWLIHHIDRSEWKLLEYKRLNRMGLPNQAWKDSDTGYLHTDGSLANADGGVAAIEVQGYAYDALLAAARLCAVDEAEASDWRTLATRLQTQTLERLWMPEAQFFAQGLDRDQNGQARQIATLTSNAAAVLDSALLLDLPEEQRQHYLQPIVRMITGSEFITAAGVRLRALRHIDLVQFADYHGTQVSWPKETYDIAKGLRRHGLVRQAIDLEQRIIDSIRQSGEFYEFYYVNREGHVKYRYRKEHPDEPQFHTFGAANTPEPGQAWTLAAFLGISMSTQKQV